jgi:Zn-dependent M32 family carboxypeptidase
MAHLKLWLKQNVFDFGRTLDANAICLKSTNNELDPLEFVHYLENKIDSPQTITQP